MTIQQIHQDGELVHLHLQLQAEQLTFDPIAVHHHDHDAAALVHRQQLKPLSRHALFPGGRHVGGVVDKGAHRPASLGQQPVQLLHFQLQGSVDLLRLVQGQLLPFHQFVDVEPVALGGGHAAR